jgi:secretion/DNA translocation related CpaE-like protein
MPATPPLLVTCDEQILDDVLRLAAAAGVDLDVAHDSSAGLRGWSSASTVLVGADLAAVVAAHQPPRRPHVHLLAHAPPEEGLFRSAVALGAQDVSELPAAEDWLVDLLSDVADGVVRSALTVGVVAGSGGAGATTFATALAITAAEAAPAMLVDLDPFGPGVDHVVGLDADASAAVPGVRWGDLAESRGRFGSTALRRALPQRGQLSVLTWSSGATAAPDLPLVREVLTAAQRGNDVVVGDLPRAGDPVTADVVGRCDHVVVVAEPTLPSAASTVRVVARLRESNSHVGLVIRGSDGSLTAERIAASLDVPLLAEMTRQRRLVEHVDLGLGPVHARRGPLARAAGEVLQRLRSRGGGAS